MMYEYKINPLSEHITQLIDPTGVFCFLVQGTEKAVLIDTGIGIKGLKETVEGLTKLPLEVILTHGHGDHAGGAADFEKVYIHSADKGLLKEHGMEMRMGYAAMAMQGVELTEADFVPVPAVDKEFMELQDGQLFDLGGITLEIVAVPGHTKGSCCVLFREERSILFGDACNANTLVLGEESTTIGAYQKSLEYLKSFKERFDTVYYSHGPAAEGPGCSLEDNMELCDRILAGTDDAVPCEFMGRPAFRAAADDGNFARVDGKYGNIVYSEITKKA